MNVLIACEESQIICNLFRLRGHNAFSCDIQPTLGNHPEWHIQDDVTKHLYGWDLIIAHPPCTYLSNAGARWLYVNHELNFDRYLKGLDAKEFFMMFFEAAPMVCIENPIPSKIYNLPSPSQIIQPYEFGEPFSKKTCLWLKNLPLLRSTKIIKEHVPYVTFGSYSLTHDKKYMGVSRAGGAARVRSRTFYGIASAMSLQWG